MRLWLAPHCPIFAIMQPDIWAATQTRGHTEVATHKHVVLLICRKNATVFLFVILLLVVVITFISSVVITFVPLETGSDTL